MCCTLHCFNYCLPGPMSPSTPSPPHSTDNRQQTSTTCALLTISSCNQKISQCQSQITTHVILMTINILPTPTHWPTKTDKIKPNLKRQKQKKSKSQPIRDSQFKRERDLLRSDRLLKYKERDLFWFINFISFFHSVR